MDVCVVLWYKDSSMEHEGQKDLKVQNGSRGENGTGKKNPTRGMDVCVVFVVRTVAWNVK
jgi:hypothetical protein